MDRLQSMRVFAKIVEQGSFARAAQMLDLSNAAVTRHVAELENHLGTRLLNRSTRKLSLTETGQAYLERVRQILPEIDDAEAVASSLSKKPNGTLKLYAQQSFGQYQLPRLLPLFAREFPDVTLDVTLSDRTVDIVEEGFDIGMFIGLQKFDANMIVRQLGIAEVSLWASPDYIERNGTPKVPEDLSRHVCLSFAFADFLHQWSIKGPQGEMDVPIVNKMTSNNGDLLSHCARAGMGIVLRPSYAMCDDLESGRLARLLPDHHIQKVAVMMVYPSRRLLSATVRSFVDFMSRQFPKPEIDPWLIDPPKGKMVRKRT
jgi:DNA-binding transcriptional LysR family regulator